MRVILDAVAERFAAEGGHHRLNQLFPGGVVAQGCTFADVPVPPSAQDRSFGSLMRADIRGRFPRGGSAFAAVGKRVYLPRGIGASRKARAFPFRAQQEVSLVRPSRGGGPASTAERGFGHDRLRGGTGNHIVPCGVAWQDGV